VSLEADVSDVVQKWSGSEVKSLTDILCELWLNGGHKSCDTAAFELLIERVAGAFPNKRIQLLPGKFTGKDPAIGTVEKLVNAVNQSKSREI
jgi:hypothetical protein